MKYRNKLVSKLIIGEILRDSFLNLRTYKYVDKWIVGIIIKLKHNPILIFLWSFWNKIALKECIKINNKYGNDLEKLTEGFVNKFIWNTTIKGSD